jgi:type IV pilus assembly protein PilA
MVKKGIGQMRHSVKKSAGLSVIELMIVVAVIAVLVSLAGPAYTNLTIRARVTEGLSTASAAKLAIEETCQTEPNAQIEPGDNAAAGYSFQTSTHVSQIAIGQRFAGNCDEIAVVVFTQNTGAIIDPILRLHGTRMSNSGSTKWTCYLVQGEYQHVPKACRQELVL